MQPYKLIIKKLFAILSTVLGVLDLFITREKGGHRYNTYNRVVHAGKMRSFGTLISPCREQSTLFPKQWQYVGHCSCKPKVPQIHTTLHITKAANT